MLVKKNEERIYIEKMSQVTPLDKAPPSLRLLRRVIKYS